jgi:adenylate cyclase class 1
VSQQPLRPIAFGQPGEEIGKKDLAAIVQRFKNLHKLQLQRIQSTLAPRQRDFLELLPLLFHVNHPLFPGFVATDTPAGIPDYTPGRTTLLRAARLSRSFELKRQVLPNYPVLGLFLMGSVGSIAYSRKSDLDIWLCHDPALDEEALEELRQKSQLVEKWAAGLDLEAHIFFINPETFRTGQGEPLSTESCGSIQHHLLLEEFYRTSLYLAGRVPAWWLVPPDQDDRYGAYLRHLLSNRFIADCDIIDFGSLERVPVSEFLGGTLWHLHKAIVAPHKSLLKLLLMESYANEYPKSNWLCARLKKSVYSGCVEAAELDAYVLMYRKVEAYLRERREYDRLDLAQQCFYLKINELLSVPAASTAEKRYRRDILQAIVEQWGWSASRLAELDGRRRCRIGQALDEHRRIGRELTRGYQGISRFAREHARLMNLENDEIVLLGRRLYAALERRPGKVEPIGQDRWEELLPEDYILYENEFADGTRGWALRTGRELASEPLKRASGWLEILAWLSLNGFFVRHSRFIVESDHPIALSMVDLKRCMQVLGAFLYRHLAEQESLDAFAVPPRIRASALFVNLNGTPHDNRKDGHVVASNRFDPLSFGATRVSLVADVDHLSLTTWHELLMQRHRGLEGLFDCCCEILNKAPPGAELPAVECHSFSSARAQSIVFRINELLRGLADGLGRSADARYVVRGGPAFFLFERRDGLVHYRPAHDENALLAELGSPRPQYGPVTFDRLALENSPLPLIHARNREGLLQIFCRPVGSDTEVYILDERGSQFFQRHRDSTPQRQFAAYALFLSAIQRHSVIAVKGLELFLLEPGGRDGGFRLREIEEKPSLSGRKLSVRIHGMDLEPGRTVFTVYCNEREFSFMEWGEHVFAQAAAHILALRQSGERYPIHVTDIDAPAAVLGADDAAALQTLHFLNYKRKVEARLNVIDRACE